MLSNLLDNALAATSAGGSLGDTGMGIAVDAAGNGYVTGRAMFDHLIPQSVHTDTLTFSGQKHTIKGYPQLFVWKVPASEL